MKIHVHNIQKRGKTVKFRFSKIAPNDDIDVTIIEDSGKEHVAPCYIHDGKIVIVDISSLVQMHQHEQVEHLTKQVNEAYAKHNSKKVEQRHRRTALKEVNHWWNALAIADKERLVMPLRDKLIAIVDALLAKNPNDIKRRHYESLIKRSQLGALTLNKRVDAKKLSKLPRYSSTDDKLHGSLYSFIALAEVCYPSLREANADSMAL